MDFLNKRVAAFANAINGLRIAFAHESHFRIHVFALLLVLNLGFYCHVSKGEWMAVMLCVGMVLAFELVNSALEYLCNIVQPEQHQKIKGIKDMAAAAVLVVALVSIVVGCLVFLPHLISG